MHSKVVSWFKSNLRDLCTSIDKNRCCLLVPADKKRRRKEACASRRRTAVKHAVMRKFLSHCVRDQKRKVICICKLHAESPPSFISFSAELTARPPNRFKANLCPNLFPFHFIINVYLLFINNSFYIYFTINIFCLFIFNIYSFIPFYFLFISIINKLINIINISYFIFIFYKYNHINII